MTRDNAAKYVANILADNIREQADRLEKAETVVDFNTIAFRLDALGVAVRNLTSMVGQN